VEPGILKRYSRENLKKREFSCSTFMIYLGVKKRYDMDHHTIVFAKDYRSNVRNIFQDRTLSDDMSFYVQNASITDPTLAPEGKSTIYILVPIGNRLGATDWAQEREPFKQMMLDLVTRRTPMKDLREQIEVERVITPLDWEEKGRIYLGATFNLSHTFAQLLYLRPRNRFEELDNCFLVVGGTHPGSGLPTIYESARISSNLLCRNTASRSRAEQPPGQGSRSAGSIRRVGDRTIRTRGGAAARLPSFLLMGLPAASAPGPDRLHLAQAPSER